MVRIFFDPVKAWCITMEAPPGYAKIVSTPSRSKAAHQNIGPVHYFAPVRSRGFRRAEDSFFAFIGEKVEPGKIPTILRPEQPQKEISRIAARTAHAFWRAFYCIYQARSCVERSVMSPAESSLPPSKNAAYCRVLSAPCR